MHAMNEPVQQNPSTPMPPPKVPGARIVSNGRLTDLPTTNPAEMSPTQRWEADQAAADRADPWRDTSKILTRDAAGNLVQREKTLGADGESRPGKIVDPQDLNAAETTPPAEGERGEKIRFGETEYTAKEISEAVAFKAEQDLRKAQIPATAAEYKLELPQDFKLPNGAQVQVAPVTDPIKGPAMRAFQEWSFKNGLSQTQFGEALGLYASATSNEQIAIANAAQREMEAAGVNAPVRVDAVSLWLKSDYPGAAKAFIATLATSKQLDAWESIITRSVNGGAGSFSRRGNEPEAEKLSDEAYGKLSYNEKKEYAAQASARAAQGGRR
jgi:hypothetical protein